MNSRDNIDGRIDRLLRGAIDPHVHSGPSIAPRALDHVELLRQASAAGFAAVVTKDHDYSSAMTTALIRRNFPELKTKIYASIVLNNVIGGFNPYAVEHTAAMGGRIVAPDAAAENHCAGASRQSGTTDIRPAAAFPCSEADKKVRDDVKEVLIVARTTWCWRAATCVSRPGSCSGSQAARREAPGFTHPEEIIDAPERRERGSPPWALCRAFAEYVLEGCKFRRRGRTCAGIEAAGVRRPFLLGPRPDRHARRRRFPPGIKLHEPATTTNRSARWCPPMPPARGIEATASAAVSRCRTNADNELGGLHVRRQ
jgi:hypothetical protein